MQTFVVVMHITEVITVEPELTGSATRMRLAYDLFGGSTIKQIPKNGIVTIRVLDQKYSYTVPCIGSTLLYNATNNILSIIGTIECQLPDTLKIIGNPDDVSMLSTVSVHIEIASMDYLLQVLQESQKKNVELERRLVSLEKRIDEEFLSLKPIRHVRDQIS